MLSRWDRLIRIIIYLSIQYIGYTLVGLLMYVRRKRQRRPPPARGKLSTRPMIILQRYRPVGYCYCVR